MKPINVFDIYRDGKYEIVISDKETVAGLKPVLTGTSMTDIAGLLTASLQMPCVMYLDESVADDGTLDKFDCSDNIRAIAIRSNLDENEYVPGPEETEAFLKLDEKVRKGKTIFSIYTDGKGVGIMCDNCKEKDFWQVAEMFAEHLDKHAEPENVTVSALLAGALAFMGRHITPENYGEMYDRFFSNKQEEETENSIPFIIPVKGGKVKS